MHALRLIAPTLVQTGYGEREGQAPRSLDLQQPLGSLVAGDVQDAIAAPCLAQRGHGEGKTRSSRFGHVIGLRMLKPYELPARRAWLVASW